MKNIVLGIDGTGTDWESATNVSRILDAAGDTGATCIYLRGLGSKKYRKVRGGVFTRGYNRHVRRSYQYLSEVYERGDRIYMVGYSRGGAAVISLANLLWSSGICSLTADPSVAREAMRIYGSRPGYAGILRAEFSDKYGCDHPEIRMLGLLDPVNAAGIALHHRVSRIRYGAHDMTLRGNVGKYVSLLALDEHRWHFRPVLQVGRHRGQDVKQIWVPGCHGDVGGGDNQPLAQYALSIMAREFSHAGLWLDLPSVHTRYKPEDCTDSFVKPYSLLPRVDRHVEQSDWVAGEQISGLARKWAIERTHDQTHTWDLVRSAFNIR